MKGTILAGALGNDVHVAGVYRFLRLAEELGYETVFLGAAVPVEEFLAAIRAHDPEIVGVSYRLTPEVGRGLVGRLIDGLGADDRKRRRFAFGGTPPVCRTVEPLGFFERCFDGLESPGDVRAFLDGRAAAGAAAPPPDDLEARIDAIRPYPLLRHHFGLPDLDETIAGVRTIAEAGVLDVVSLAPDQNAQESFFRPDERDPALDGAGGAPIRTERDLVLLKAASKAGNHPMMRIYSGTRDLVRWADLARGALRNAWGAVPLFWYSVLDGRSKRPLEDAIRENLAAMRWHGLNGVPLEVNESHHWSLRDAHDAVAVAAAYLAAYNAKAAGVRTYVAQYMFNSPPMLSAAMDFARVQAMVDFVESLHDDGFHSYRQVRAGLAHLSPRSDVAKGQLAASTMLALGIRPQIIHVVGFCEGDHAARPEDVVESCGIVQGVLRNARTGLPDFLADPDVDRRRHALVGEATILLEAIRTLGRAAGSKDPLSDPAVLAEAVRIGLLDAPHLKGNAAAAGRISTRCIDGAMVAWDEDRQRALSEPERIAERLSARKGG